MLIELSQAVGDYFYDVFVRKFEWWVLLGYLAQIMFTMRFVVQWIASERAGRSYVPVVFWYLSIAGSLILLAYAIHRRDPVFTLAFLPNCVVYVRNLVLLRRTGAQESPSEL